MTDLPKKLTSQICELVADALGLEHEEVTADSSMDSVDDWDSLQHLGVISALEADFDLVIGPDDIADLNSIAAIVRFVAKSVAVLEGAGR